MIYFSGHRNEHVVAFELKYIARGVDDDNWLGMTISDRQILV